MEALCARLKKLAVQLEGLSAGAASSETRGMLDRGLLALMELKSVFRTVCLATEEERHRTEAAKVLLDQAQLVLQNILYEKSFYLTETRAILDFPSKFTETQVGLMPAEEFQATAPASFRETASTPHQVMCCRLAHEKHARAEAVAQLEQLKSRRDALAAIAAQRWNFLGCLQDELNGVVAGAEPIRGRLGIECAGACSAAAAAAARVLPPPLLSAYTLLSAAVRGYGMRATVAVAGARPQQQQSMRPACPSLLADVLPAQSDEGVAEALDAAADARPGKRGRPESGDGGPPAKRGRSQGPDPGLGATPPAPALHAVGDGGTRGAFEVRRSKHQAAPQEVVLELLPAQPAAGAVPSPNPAAADAAPLKGATLRLRWLPDLLVACAACDNAAHDVALRWLLLGDNGACAPSAAAAAAAAAAGGGVEWRALKAGRPFRWAQRLCGLDTTPPAETAGAAATPTAAQAEASGSALGAQALLQRLATLAQS